MFIRYTFLSSLLVSSLVVATSSMAADVAEKTGKVAGRVNVEPLSGGTMAQVALGLLFVLFLVVAVAWLLKRMGGLSITGNGALKILGGLSMGSRERVVLMQVGEEQLLIGVSPGRIQTLHVLDKPIRVDDKKNTESGFAERLNEALSRRRDK
jgi:flagellar protein FliO/FliZ